MYLTKNNKDQILKLLIFEGTKSDNFPFFFSHNNPLTISFPKKFYHLKQASWLDETLNPITHSMLKDKRLTPQVSLYIDFFYILSLIYKIMHS